MLQQQGNACWWQRRQRQQQKDSHSGCFILPTTTAAQHMHYHDLPDHLATKHTHTHTHCHLINYYKHHSAQELLLQTLPQQSESAPNLRKQTQPKQNWMSRVRHSVFGKVNEPISPFSCELFGYTTTSFRFWVVSFCPFLVLFSSFACGRFGFSFTLHFSFFPLFFRLSLSFSCFCILKLCCLSFAWPAWWTRVSWCEWDHGHCHKHTHTHTQTTLTSLVVPNQQKL